MTILTLDSLVASLAWAVGTEHMIVCFVDRILHMLDKYSDKSAAVISAFLDWAAAFDRQDPTIEIQKFIKIGVRASGYIDWPAGVHCPEQ